MRSEAHQGIHYAVVTGASSGIGKKAVESLLKAGAQVLATDVTDSLQTQHAGNPNVHVLIGDITQEGFAEQVMAEATARFPAVDRVLHCAGIMPGGYVRDVDLEQTFRVLDINYGGTVRMVKAALPVLRGQGRGQLVVLGSLTGYVPMQKFAAYSASKAAVASYVEILAEEEKHSGVQVLLVAPTAVQTPLLAQADKGPKFIGELTGASAKLLMIQPEDVLEAIERGLRRGQSVVVPGGRLALLGRRVSRTLAWAATNRFN